MNSKITHTHTHTNELSSHKKTWRNCKDIFLNERSLSEKAIYCMIPALLHSKKGKTMATAKTLVVARDGGGGEGWGEGLGESRGGGGGGGGGVGWWGGGGSSHLSLVI